MELKDEQKRQCRKVSEKRRRDEFNALIAEIAASLPLSGSRTDKASVLQETIAFLLAHRTGVDEGSKKFPYFIQDQQRPQISNSQDLIHLLLELLAGFLLTFTSAFQVLFVSPNHPQYLGNTTLLAGTSLLDIISPIDHPALESIFVEGSSVPCSLLAHVLSGTSYKPMLLHCTRLDNIAPGVGPVVLALCHLPSPHLLPVEPLWTPCDSSGFTTHLSPDFKLMELDSKAMLILGSGLIGTSLYEHCHPEDLVTLAEGHRMLCKTGRGHTSPYRICTKRQTQVRLYSQFHLFYDPWTAIPKFILATHQFV